MEITPILIKNKAFNKVVAILLDFICGFFKRVNNLTANQNGTILIIALHKLGDSILAVQAIRELENYYKTRISLLCFNEICDVYNIIFERINLVQLSKSDFYFEQRIASRRARSTVRKLKPEVIIDLTGSISSASLIFNSRAKKIIGINSHIFRKLYSDYVPIRRHPHLIDIYLDVTRRIIPMNGSSIKLIQKQYSSEGYILIHPFAGWAAKEWGFKKFVELAEVLNKKFECIIVFPTDRIKTDVVNELDSKKIRYIETKSMSDLIQITKRCSVFIGNDSGPLHLASLLGKATFSIFGPTNPEFHLPVTGINRYFSKEINCSPQKGDKLCFTNGGRNGCPSFECMNNISVHEVETNLLEFLKIVFQSSNHFENV